MMRVCVRDGYVDVSVANRIDENLLKQEPYNYQIVEVADEFSDLAFIDFDIVCEKFKFNLEKYKKRKQKMLAQSEIFKLKNYLVETDYKAIKFAEGVISEEDYLEEKQKRQEARDRINELEKIIND